MCLIFRFLEVILSSTWSILSVVSLIICLWSSSSCPSELAISINISKSFPICRSFPVCSTFLSRLVPTLDQSAGTSSLWFWYRRNDLESPLLFFFFFSSLRSLFANCFSISISLYSFFSCFRLNLFLNCCFHEEMDFKLRSESSRICSVSNVFLWILLIWFLWSFNASAVSAAHFAVWSVITRHRSNALSMSLLSLSHCFKACSLDFNDSSRPYLDWLISRRCLWRRSRFSAKDIDAIDSMYSKYSNQWKRIVWLGQGGDVMWYELCWETILIICEIAMGSGPFKS